MLLNVVLEKTVESPLDSKEIKPVYPKGNQSRLFIERSDAEAETPILWLPDAKNWLIGKDPDAGKDWTQEEKGMAEDEMVGWHHWLTGHESEQAPRVGDGQGSLMICAPWGRKESDVTEQLNWTELNRSVTNTPEKRTLKMPIRASHFYLILWFSLWHIYMALTILYSILPYFL